MSQLLKSSGAMSAATMLSRVLGLARDIFYTRFMGTTWVADAFNLAFMVPNLFRRLLGEGALTAAFIPIFKEKEKLSGEREMWRVANAVVSGLVAAASLVAVAGMAIISLFLLVRVNGMPALNLFGWLDRAYPAVLGLSLAGLALAWFSRGEETARRKALTGYFVVAGIAALFFVLALGAISGGVLKESGGGKTLLMLQLLRLMFPYVVLVCLAAFFMGMLNARGHFFVPAMGATTLNLVMIASVIWLAPAMGDQREEQIFGLAIGVVLAGIAQAGFQLPLLHQEGFRYRWISPWRDETVRRVVTQMIPGTIGVAAYQINVLLTQSMAFWVGPGVISSFTVAVRLMELPQGVFGISLATFLLPTLSGFAAEKKYPEFRSTLAQGLGWLVFVNLLAAALLFSLAEPMIRLLFERGAFDEASTADSALALRCLAPGLVSFSLVNILARAFFALGDTKTPMRIGVFCLALNLVVSGVLVWQFKQAGLGVANTLTATVNMSLLLFSLRKKLKTLDFPATFRRHLGILIVTACFAGGIAWGVYHLWARKVGHEHFVQRMGEVFVPIAVASLFYIGVAALFRTGYTQELFSLFRRRLKPRA